MSESPRIAVAIHVGPAEEAAVQTIFWQVRRAGVEYRIAFGLSDLEVFARNGEFDLAVIDLSLAGVHDFVPRFQAGHPDIPLVSMRFLIATEEPVQPAWARRHVVYRNANQFSAELRELADDWTPSRPG